MSNLRSTFHCQGPSEHERGTAVSTEELGDCATVRLGVGGEMPVLTIFITRPAEAFAIAQAFATAGEILEARAALSRRGEVPAEAWQDVPLPLDVTDDPATAQCPNCGIVAERRDGHQCLDVTDPATAQLCACGKPERHVLAPPDTAEWACRVPSVYPALEAVAREMDAPDTAEWSCRVPSVVPLVLEGPTDYAEWACIHGVREQCRQVGCADERCPAF